MNERNENSIKNKHPLNIKSQLEYEQDCLDFLCALGKARVRDCAGRRESILASSYSSIEVKYLIV